MDAVLHAYRSAADRMPGVGLNDFRAFASACKVTPVVVDGKCAGAVLVRGSEIHACIQSWAKGRWFQRAHLRLLSDVINMHGFAQTSATTADGVEFVSRLGFVRDGDKLVIYGR